MRRRRYIGLKEFGVSDLTKQLKIDNSGISMKHSLKDFFSPPSREQDSFSRALESKKWSTIPKRRIHSKGSLKAPSSPKLTNKYKGEVPAVGTYDFQQGWIKHSFSNKILSFTPLESPSKLMIPGTSETPKPKMRIRRKAHHKLPKNISIPERKKGIWEDLRLHGTPEYMKSVFSFKSEIRQLLEYQLNISKSLEKLRETAFGDNINNVAEN